MWLKWLPWKWIVRRAARAHGFLDPIALLAYLRRFAQPSEVQEPVELLRAGVVLHARGLMNSRSIQHNLDWVWPYWVQRQFDPNDDAFVPRAFSITHINLTHRNWTAVGVPGCPHFPIVDPAGALTPLIDRWSLDGWILTGDGSLLAPSRTIRPRQRLELGPNLAVITDSQWDGCSLRCEVDVCLRDRRPVACLRLTGRSSSQAWMVVSLRPYNPEGVSFIHTVALSEVRRGWLIDDERLVDFSGPAERHAVSDYHDGDVSLHLARTGERDKITCDVGMVTAAAMFELEPDKPREIAVTAPLKEDHQPSRVAIASAEESWSRAMERHCRLDVADQRVQFLYDAALRTLVLHSPDDVYPGPYTYKRFWFRDAAFILNAMLCAGLEERAERVLDRFPQRQTPFGYFHSQEGEWDSNGEALWIMRRFCQLTGRRVKTAWLSAIEKGAHWIVKKRLPNEGEAPHAGLLPAGFSAEHLGPNDYYYWDDFWGVAGLRAATEMLGAHKARLAEHFDEQADDLMHYIERSLALAAGRLGRSAMPAAPSRRLDAGAIGSIVAGYPLHLMPSDDPRLLDTVNYLMDVCSFRGGFFQDMIHSGINPYLTLHIAQVMLRANDPRSHELLRVVADLASPTGQWPEAVHPRTLGGCMGDGQHVWAAAEWVMMVRNCFLYEEAAAGRLVLGAGIPEDWLAPDRPLAFGPAPTIWGTVSITLEPKAESLEVRWRADWRAEQPEIEVRPPGFQPVVARPDQTAVRIDALPPNG